MDTPKEVNVVKVVGYALLGVLGLIVLLGTFYTVSAGEIAVKTRFGKVVGVSDNGLHGKLPLMESVTKINVKAQVVKNEHFVNEKGEVISDNALSAASKDLQDVKVSTVVSYKVDEAKVEELFTQYRTEKNFEEAVVKPIIKEAVKTLTAQYTAEELVTKRAELNTLIVEVLSTKFSDKMAIFVQGNITNIEFSPSFTQAIERKVTAEQDALASKNKLEQTKYEGEQKIVSAKAEAESIRIQSQAINSQGGQDYVNLKLIEAWNGVLPTYVLGENNSLLMNLGQ